MTEITRLDTEKNNERTTDIDILSTEGILQKLTQFKKQSH